MTEKKISYHAFINSGNAYYTTDTPASFSYNIEGFLPYPEYEYYTVNIEYIKINHRLNTDGYTFVPYDAYSYNVLINFGNKLNNTISTDQYLNMFCGNTVGYESRPYWNTTTGAVDYSYSMSVSSLIGYNGPKFCIYRPNPIIKIQILNDSGQELTDYNNDVITYVKLLLKFKPIY